LFEAVCPGSVQQAVRRRTAPGVNRITF
jgi:hypothetical protein